jgi:hypothetical protein
MHFGLYQGILCSLESFKARWSCEYIAEQQHHPSPQKLKVDVEASFAYVCTYSPLGLASSCDHLHMLWMSNYYVIGTTTTTIDTLRAVSNAYAHVHTANQNNRTLLAG